MQYGFDKPWTFRYVRWLGKLLQGDLGYPLKGAKPVARQIGERIPSTLLLMGAALLLALIIGVPIGIIMALKQYSGLDMVLTVFVFALLSLPSFFVGLGAIYIFALKLDILPTYGMQTIGAPFSLIDRARHLIMPAAILGLAAAGTYARLHARQHVGRDALRVRDHGACQGPERTRRRGATHLSQRACYRSLRSWRLSCPPCWPGAIITEQIFQWPGIGMLTVKRTSERDYPVLMGITVLTAIMILFSNLLADILYAAIDPRIRYDKVKLGKPTDHECITNDTSANAARSGRSIGSHPDRRQLDKPEVRHPRTAHLAKVQEAPPGRCRLDLHLGPRPDPRSEPISSPPTDTRRRI